MLTKLAVVIHLETCWTPQLFKFILQFNFGLSIRDRIVKLIDIDKGPLIINQTPSNTFEWLHNIRCCFFVY